LPPDVRKGFAFPICPFFKSFAVEVFTSNREASSFEGLCGKAEPYRTSGGKAAQHLTPGASCELAPLLLYPAA
jgi:hypothetical protein